MACITSLANVLLATGGLALVSLATGLVFPPPFLISSLAVGISPYSLAGVVVTAILLALARRGGVSRPYGAAVIVSVVASAAVANWFGLIATVAGLALGLAPASTEGATARLVYLGAGLLGSAFYLFNGWALTKGWRLLRQAGHGH